MFVCFIVYYCIPCRDWELTTIRWFERSCLVPKSTWSRSRKNSKGNTNNPWDNSLRYRQTVYNYVITKLRRFYLFRMILPEIIARFCWFCSENRMPARMEKEKQNVSISSLFFIHRSRWKWSFVCSEERRQRLKFEEEQPALKKISHEAIYIMMCIYRYFLTENNNSYPVCLAIHF